MCEICKWIEENNLLTRPMRLKVPYENSDMFSRYVSPYIKVKYCPKCGRRLKK